MKTKQMTLYILFIILTLLFSCTYVPEIFIRQAGQNASELFVKGMQTSHRKNSIERIGVFAINNDTKQLQIRQSLYNALIQYPKLDIVNMDEMEEKINSLVTIGKQLKYSKYYSEQTLIDIGKNIGQKCILIGSINIIHQGLRSATVSFHGQILDLEKGILLYGTETEGSYCKPISKAEIGISILIGIILIFILIPLTIRISHSNYLWGNTPEKKYRRYLLWAAVLFPVIAGFIIYYLILS